MEHPAQASTVIHSGTLVDANGQRPGWVLLEHARVAAVATAGQPVPEAARTIDASGCYVTPGFVDIHGHGAAGVHYQDGLDEALAAVAAMRSRGATRVLASLVTSSIDDLVSAIGTLRTAMSRDPGLIGVHVEGPYLAPARKGAHDATLLRHPDPASIERLLDAAGPALRQVTIAPELPGALDAVHQFVDAGVPVAVGHTDCDHDTAREAFARGASLVTHAFNAMAPIQGRLPGVLGAAVADEHVTIEVIADGIHVHPASISLLFAAAPGRVALVTDAMAGACGPPGRYKLGSIDVEVGDGRAVVAGTTTLAGSTLTPDRALRTVVNDCGVPLDTAIAALTTTPAHAIDEPDAPLLTEGSRGDVVVLDASLAITDVIVG